MTRLKICFKLINIIQNEIGENRKNEENIITSYNHRQNISRSLTSSSVVPFNFIVQEPNGIIECTKEISLFSSFFIYRNNSVSE